MARELLEGGVDMLTVDANQGAGVPGVAIQEAAESAAGFQATVGG